ncbi:hypothetical protein AGLY_006440 [Aphis glycines]|uniref:Uncharacterized protein n=1 Tax=Aphis glycines TaxID=307491 RepID=A0A6G0TR29_APHGL|nr:hypothetical protein AGLY_006440 [Aphis glycines]
MQVLLTIRDLRVPRESLIFIVVGKTYEITVDCIWFMYLSVNSVLHCNIKKVNDHIDVKMSLRCLQSSVLFTVNTLYVLIGTGCIIPFSSYFYCLKTNIVLLFHYYDFVELILDFVYIPICVMVPLSASSFCVLFIKQTLALSGCNDVFKGRNLDILPGRTFILTQNLQGSKQSNSLTLLDS